MRGPFDPPAVRDVTFCEDGFTGVHAMADDAALLDALREVVDPELMINIVDLGLIYDIEPGRQQNHRADDVDEPRLSGRSADHSAGEDGS